MIILPTVSLKTTVVNTQVVPVGVFVYTATTNTSQGKAQKNKTADKEAQVGVHNNLQYGPKHTLQATDIVLPPACLLQLLQIFFF